MSVATPKSQASSPIDLDIFLVCKKLAQDARTFIDTDTAFENACQATASKVKRFNRSGRELSANDVKVILFSQILVDLSPGRSQAQFFSDFESIMTTAETEVTTLWQRQAENEVEPQPSAYQLPLF
jgi:putative DNA methylase